jgi:transcription initiation factor TFIIE subunit alpha
MLDQFLKEIVVITVGKQAEPIAELLNNKKHINEFVLAKKLNLTINQTRNILYKLSDFGIISSIRKKDKKKGWYTYYWKFEIMKCLLFLKDLLAKRLEELDKEMSDRHKKVFYVCESCGLEYTEEESLLKDFTCDECGQIFSTKDDAKHIKDLSKTKERIQERLAEVEVELSKEYVFAEKRKGKEIKKEIREKEQKRADAAAKRKATRDKKVGPVKKVVKKKIENSMDEKKKPSKTVSKKMASKKVFSKKVLKKISKKK